MPQPILSVNPTNQPVGSASGSTSFAVTNIGNGTMNWSAVVTFRQRLGTDHIGIDGVNGGVVIVGYDANAGASSRQATVRVTASGATGSPANVTVTQAGNPGQQHSVVRSISGSSVSIAVIPEAGTMVYAVEESIPAGLPFRGSMKAALGRRQPKSENGVRGSMRTRVPSHTRHQGRTGAIMVSGTASFDGVGQSVTGPSTIHIGDDPNKDSDGDGMSDWAESIAGTDPTNKNSHLKFGFPASGVYAPSDNGVVLQWYSASNRFYHLNRSTNLISGFNQIGPIEIQATPSLNVYTDTTATGIGPYFYKVGVEKRP